MLWAGQTELEVKAEEGIGTEKTGDGEMQGARFWDRQNVGMCGTDTSTTAGEKSVPEKMLSFSLLGYILSVVSDCPNTVQRTPEAVVI